MRPVKRAFPRAVWLVAFLLPVAASLPGFWLLWEKALPSASLPDFSPLLHADRFNRLIPGLETALYATLLCLALGYPAGCLLALWRRRTAFVACLMPFSLLGGAALLYGQRLNPHFAQGFLTQLLARIHGYAAPFEAIALILFPLTVLCTCSFAKAVDPALARAARCLGASRLRALVTLTFPRTLKGVPAAFILVFLPALALSLASGQAPGTAFGFAAPSGAVLLLLTLAAIIICLLILRKSRSVSPC